LITRRNQVISVQVSLTFCVLDYYLQYNLYHLFIDSKIRVSIPKVSKEERQKTFFNISLY